MPLAPKEKARLDLRYRTPAAADAITPALAAQLATSAQGAKADTAFSWGNHVGLYASLDQGAKADEAYLWGNHAGLYVPQQPGFPVAVIVQLAARNVPGGRANAAPEWNLRLLNTIVGPGTAGGVTVSAGDVIVPSGTYWFSGWALAYGVLGHVLRIRVTSPSGATIASGSSERAPLLAQTKATVEGVSTLGGAGPHTIQLQHRVQTPASPSSDRDLGTPANLVGTPANLVGTPANLVSSGEIYAGLTIWRLA